MPIFIAEIDNSPIGIVNVTTRRDEYIINLSSIFFIYLAIVLLNIIIYFFINKIKNKNRKKHKEIQSKENKKKNNLINIILEIILFILTIILFILIVYKKVSNAIMATSVEYYGNKFAVLNFLFIMIINIIIEVILTKSHKLNVTQIVFNSVIESSIVIFAIIGRIIFNNNLFFIILTLFPIVVYKLVIMYIKKVKPNLILYFALIVIYFFYTIFNVYNCRLLSSDLTGMSINKPSIITISNYCEGYKGGNATGFKGRVSLEIGDTTYYIQSPAEIFYSFIQDVLHR